MSAAAFDVLPNEQIVIAAAGRLAQAALPAADRAAERRQPFDEFDVEDPAIWQRSEANVDGVCHRTLCDEQRRATVIAAIRDDDWYREQLTNMLKYWPLVQRTALDLIEQRHSFSDVLRFVSPHGDRDTDPDDF